MEPQKPTLARIVIFHEDTENEGQVDMAAIVNCLHPDGTIGLTIFTPWGGAHSRRHVTEGNEEGQWSWPLRAP